MAKRTLRAETIDLDLLEARYPEAIKTVKAVNYSVLYEKAKAHLVTGEPIPGVIIIRNDGTTLPAVATEQVAAQNLEAATSKLDPANPLPHDYMAA